MNLPPHEWLRDLRQRARLRQTDIQYRTTTLGGQIPKYTVSQLENGGRPLATLTPKQVSALCQVLGITPEEWAAHTGQPHSTYPDRDSA